MFSLTLVLKTTLILLNAGAVTALMRRCSSAARQLVWTLALAAVMLLPLLSTSVPRVEATIPTPVPPQQPSRETVFSVASTPAPVEFPWRRTLEIVYQTGVAFVLGRMLIGSARIARLARKAEPYPDAGRWQVPVLVTRRLAIPVTWGLFRPVILLPAAARAWPADRLRLVIAHEMAHIRRWDFAGQVVAQLACALYWFHPLSWWAFKQLIKEREQGCDDEVLNMGIKGTIYAEHLLGIIRSAGGNKSEVFSPAIGMAQGSAFEHRLKSILNPGVNRSFPGRRTSIAAVLTATLLLLPFSALQLSSQTAGSAIQGVVRDPSGAGIPDARIFAVDADSSNLEAAVSGPDGSFRLTGLKPGRYKIEITAKGFARFQRPELDLATGKTATLNAELNVGSVNESLEVIGKRAVPVAHAAPQRIRVGGNVQASKLLRQPPPTYPDDALRKGIEGTVVLRAVIGTDGRLLSLSPAGTSPDPQLTKAALDAVQLWTYEPTLLNGQPVEVSTTIAVTFRLQ